MISLFPRPKQPPVRHSPHAGGEGLHLAAAGDDETEPPGVLCGAAGGQGGEHLRQRARVGAVGLAAGLDLDGEETIGSVEDDVHLAPAVGAEEVKRRRVRLPRRPAEHLVDDGGLEESAIRGRRVLAEEGARPGSVQ